MKQFFFATNQCGLNDVSRKAIELVSERHIFRIQTEIIRRTAYKQFLYRNWGFN